MSFPGAAMTAMVKRMASVPYRACSSAGSITFPLLLDIFWPAASRTRPWMYTSRNGGASMNLRPIMIMRATQKKMMSKPVIRRSVG
jgi:hypothetical protein